MKNFVFFKGDNSIPMLNLEKAVNTVIKPGDMVELDGSKLAIIATATATKIAYAPAGGDAGKDYVEVVGDKDAQYLATGAINYAETQRGVVYDLANAGGVQTLNQSATAVKVLTVSPGYDAGTVGATTDIVVKIAAPLW
jgi:hypothetical protein